MPRGAARNTNRVPNQKKELRKQLFIGQADSRVPCAGCDDMFLPKALLPLVEGGNERFCSACRRAVHSLLEPLTSRSDLDGYYQRMYQIPFKTYADMFMRQRARCAICQMPPRGRQLVVDHCHTSGRVRGLLCGTCNSGLGMFKDSIPSLARAIVYLT